VTKKAGKRKAGLPALRSPAFGRLTSGKRTVTRAYGGTLRHDEVKDRYSIIS